MKALFELFRRFDARRIFGFIRRFGSMSRPKVKCYDLRSTRALRVEGDRSRRAAVGQRVVFLSTPSGWRATKNPRKSRKAAEEFLSTPSGWRATWEIAAAMKMYNISIHALRVEGDESLSRSLSARARFLSTPSGWRATQDEHEQRVQYVISIHALRVEGDVGFVERAHDVKISIHALRVEGDLKVQQVLNKLLHFYPRPPGGGRPKGSTGIKQIITFLSTPSGWRATSFIRRYTERARFLSTPSGWRATFIVTITRVYVVHFYPRPPGGGRHTHFLRGDGFVLISIHALRVEGDHRGAPAQRSNAISIHALRVEGDGRMLKHYERAPVISIHALRVEGDRSVKSGSSSCEIFLSTPSGWRATAKTDKVFVCFCAKGRRICLFKTRKEKICRWRFKKDKFWVLIWCEGSGKSVCALASHCG